MWLDVETHAFVQPEVSHIVDIGLYVIFPDDAPAKEWGMLVRPPVPITQEAAAKHGITNEMVADAHTFAEMARVLNDRMTNVDFGGYNVTFDLRVFMGEFARCGFSWSPAGAFIVDPLRIWQLKLPRGLAEAVDLFCKRQPRGAHRALPDTLDAHDVFVGQCEMFSDLPRTPQALHELAFAENVDLTGKFKWRGNDVICTFGKHVDKSLVWIAQRDRNYLQWIIDKDFPTDTKRIAQDALVGIFPQKAG